jgi:hypothetical protein
MKSGIFLVFAFIAILSWNPCLSQAQESEPGQESPILGHLDKKEVFITIFSGGNRSEIFYTIKDKEGRFIERGISAGQLAQKYPNLHKEMKTGIAGNSALLLH